MSCTLDELGERVGKTRLSLVGTSARAVTPRLGPRKVARRAGNDPALVGLENPRLSS